MEWIIILVVAFLVTAIYSALVVSGRKDAESGYHYANAEEDATEEEK